MQIKGNFMLDHGVIKSMIEGKKKEMLILAKIAEMHMREKPVKGMVFLAHFLRGISDANSMMPIKNIKKIMECIEIIPDLKKIDYKDDEALTNEIIDFMKALDELEKMKRSGKLDEFMEKHGKERVVK